MTVSCTPSVLDGKIGAISSKSDAHRILICASLCDKQTYIKCNVMSKDIAATICCLKSMGTDISVNEDIITVTPKPFNKKADLDCGESGSTLRFLMPLVSALDMDVTINGHGRLPQRPISPLKEEMEKNGVTFHTDNEFPLHLTGRLQSGEYELLGNVSSQFITGLLLSLPLLQGDSKIKLIPPVESKSYLDITVSVLKKFGIEIVEQENLYIIKGNQKFLSPNEITVDGDWSNASFFLCAGALSEKGVTVTNLDVNSPQGDKKILDVLSSMGADVEIKGNEITVKKNALKGITIDASDIPDAVPIISVVATFCSGETRIINAGRLRIKESDRIKSVVDMLKSVGADAKETDDGIIINGKSDLQGGLVNGYNDHRIVMSASILSTLCKGNVKITDYKAVEKSYPDFFTDFNKMGGNANVINDRG
ncbi:MAG: 3-phosphoshikimate 1-carboxyvinyltransferase [Clostridia bacterium]|nr:3-phosphoshikimate 1-carboxyvinyltransferase [Clostridia bacterium]